MMGQNWLRANWDRATAWACVAASVVVLFIGWQGVSRAVYPASQLPYVISGGIGGALLLAFGATLLISADLRDEWQKLDEIAARLPEPAPEATPVPDTPNAASGNGQSLIVEANQQVGQPR